MFISDKEFNLINQENSILPYLGYTRNNYYNKKKYHGTNSIDIGDNIFYLIIENISEDALFLINNDTETIKKIKEIDDELEIDHLVIKFYKTKNNIIKNNKEYSFFFEDKHDIQFEFL